MQAIKSDMSSFHERVLGLACRWFATVSLYLYKKGVTHDDVIKNERICFECPK